jgi:hypothetical protein
MMAMASGRTEEQLVMKAAGRNEEQTLKMWGRQSTAKQDVGMVVGKAGNR